MGRGNRKTKTKTKTRTDWWIGGLRGLGVGLVCQRTTPAHTLGPVARRRNESANRANDRASNQASNRKRQKTREAQEKRPAQAHPRQSDPRHFGSVLLSPTQDKARQKEQQQQQQQQTGTLVAVVSTTNNKDSRAGTLANNDQHETQASGFCCA